MAYLSDIENYVPQNEQETNDKKIILSYSKEHPHNVLTRENEIAHITASALIVNLTLTKTLMIHHNIRDTWAWTGGHADGDSDLLRVALREAKEETGIADIAPLCGDIASLDILMAQGHVKNGRYVSSHLHLSVAYLLICDDTLSVTIKPDENSGVRWFRFTEINEDAFTPSDVYLYSKLINRAIIAREACQYKNTYGNR